MHTKLGFPFLRIDIKIALFQLSGSTVCWYDNEKLTETGKATVSATFARKAEGIESGPEEKEHFAFFNARKTLSGEKSISTNECVVL